MERLVIVNNPLELTCMASGIPAPKITWMKDGRPLPQMDQMQTLGGGEVLRISSTQVSSEFRWLFCPRLNFLLANLWGVLEKLSWSLNISQISVTLARVDLFYDMHDWIDTYKVTWLKQRSEIIRLSIEGSKIPSCICIFFQVITMP